MSVQPPAPSPCASCPYRRDVPAGIWDAGNYANLPRYDAPTGDQPWEVFLCHQLDKDSERARVCGGWAGCHDGEELLSLRLALGSGRMTPEAVRAVCDYVSPVPLFSSGAEAAAHGVSGIDNPGPAARRAIEKIRRVRRHLR